MLKSFLVHSPQPLKAGYAAPSIYQNAGFLKTPTGFKPPRERGQFPHAIADCPITLFSQQRPLTGRQKPIPEASSMCP